MRFCLGFTQYLANFAIASAIVGNPLELRRVRIPVKELNSAHSKWSLKYKGIISFDPAMHEFVRISKCLRYCEQYDAVEGKYIDGDPRYINWNAIKVEWETDSRWTCSCNYVDPSFPKDIVEARLAEDPNGVQDFLYLPGSLPQHSRLK